MPHLIDTDELRSAALAILNGARAKLRNDQSIDPMRALSSAYNDVYGFDDVEEDDEGRMMMSRSTDVGMMAYAVAKGAVADVIISSLTAQLRIVTEDDVTEDDVTENIFAHAAEELTIDITYLKI